MFTAVKKRGFLVCPSQANYQKAIKVKPVYFRMLKFQCYQVISKLTNWIF